MVSPLSFSHVYLRSRLRFRVCTNTLAGKPPKIVRPTTKIKSTQQNAGATQHTKPAERLLIKLKIPFLLCNDIFFAFSFPSSRIHDTIISWLHHPSSHHFSPCTHNNYLLSTTGTAPFLHSQAAVISRQNDNL